MAYAVLLRLDAAGACPVIVSADDELPSADGTRWRFVAATDSLAEAVRLHEQLHERQVRGELLALLSSPVAGPLRAVE